MFSINKYSVFLVPVLVRDEGIFLDTRRTFERVQVLDTERMVLKKFSFFQLRYRTLNQDVTNIYTSLVS